MGQYQKEPQARIGYAIDWSPRLARGATIAESRWRVSPNEPGGMTAQAAEAEPGQTAASISGGRVGQTYRIANRVTFSDGRVAERMVALNTGARR